jgi:hypothetical protein
MASTHFRHLVMHVILLGTDLSQSQAEWLPSLDLPSDSGK